MNKENDEYLVNKYPKIFKNRYGNMRETAMCWGFSCGDGWFWLIDNLCSQIQWKIDHPSWKDGKPQVIEQVVATQVKEKFGGLCFYVECASPEIYAIIHFAESISHSICEECGSTKNIGHTNGWITTLCEDCSKSEKYKNKEWIKKDKNEKLG